MVRPVAPLLLVMLPPPAIVPIEWLILFMSSVAPLAIVAAEPVLKPAELVLNLSVPALIFVAPVFDQSLVMVVRATAALGHRGVARNDARVGGGTSCPSDCTDRGLDAACYVTGAIAERD